MKPAVILPERPLSAVPSLWELRRRAISRRSASRKVASRTKRGRETSGSETGTALSEINGRSDRTVQQLLKWLNAEFPVDPEVWQYFTFLCGMLDLRTGTMRYASAGHPGPIHVPVRSEPVALEAAGLPIGWFADVEYDEFVARFGPGDRLYLYSDGLTEAMNESDEDFGKAGLLGSLTSTWKWQPEKGPLRPREKGPPGLACQYINPASSERGGARVAHRREPAIPAATDSNREPAVPAGRRRSVASRETSWTAGTPSSRPGRKAHSCCLSGGTDGVSPAGP